jgi:hypothetical protein
MDVEGADRRREMASDTAARSAAEAAGCARATRARVLHLRTRILR